MVLILTIVAAFGLIVAIGGVCRARKQLAHTTLVSAWRWSVAAIVVWTLAWGTSVLRVASPHLQDLLWYAAGLFALCPAVAVLGARRPGTGDWTAFVIVPLLAVLGWPALTLWGGGGAVSALRLETPLLLGFMLVLLMGAGNYIGTRFSVPAAIYVVALCLIVGTVSDVAPITLQGSTTARQLATIGLGLSILFAVCAARTAPDRPNPIDGLWRAYRNTFGIVWGRRFQDRLNGIAEQQLWPARLEHDGLAWNTGASAEAQRETLPKIAQTFRWLLRRFADPDWIAAQLGGDDDMTSAPEAFR